MVNNLFTPLGLIGRSAELQQISQILAADGDFSLVGAPGIGRRTLIYAAAQQAGARVIELDCLRITNAQRLLQLLASGLLQIFAKPQELGLIQRWSLKQPVVLEQGSVYGPRLVWSEVADQEWPVFQALLALPQLMAEWLDCRVVVLFLNFPHLRSWDRTGQWEAYLRQEIQRQNRVSYALVSTVVEPWIQQSQLPVIALAPLADEIIQDWLTTTLAPEGFEFSQDALELFTDNVQGHLGDAIALARRIWLDQRALAERQPASEAERAAGRKTAYLMPEQIEAHHVHRSTLALVDDLSVTFESLILLLPPSQVRVLESLALDPTDKPQSREYIQKHQLSRGGSLQGALSSLEQKGLLYGPAQGYRVALPFLTFWLRQRLS
jgi:hypothetical protein